MEKVVENIKLFIRALTLTQVLPVAVFALVLWFFSRFVFGRDGGKLEAQEGDGARPRFGFAHKVYPMVRLDVLVLAAIMLVYGAVAFIGLGDTKAPQSFMRFEDNEYSILLDLGEVRELTGIRYYTGLGVGRYSFRCSLDGESWSQTGTMQQSYAKLFNWLDAALPLRDGVVVEEARYIQIWGSPTPIELGEIALYGAEGKLIPASEIHFSGKAAALFDEQELTPQHINYMNSAYFDEIYHARTAYEHIEGVYPYEVSHPPLGKLIIGLGIRLFGMTPFGWRFMGTLFGVLMLPFIYLLLKNMFGSTLVAGGGTVLFAFDFMHFVQTRISTIDTYGVFFILAMFFFMYRYIAMDYDAPLKKTLLPLGLSGLMFGVGCASKWIVVYGGAGLAVLWLIRQILVFRSGRKHFGTYITQTVLFSVLFFVLIPAGVYIAAYYPYGKAAGVGFMSGDYLKIVWDNQKFMFNYHSKYVLGSTHGYSSPWYSWLLDIRPILYYLEYQEGGWRSAFGAFGNPVVWWGGLVAVIWVARDFFRTRDGRALFIVVGYLAQLLPWVAVSRIVFIYHYFPSTVFLVLAIGYCFARIVERRGERAALLPVAGFSGAAVLLFAVFYPVLTGVAVPGWYATNFLAWIPFSWPF